MRRANGLSGGLVAVVAGLSVMTWSGTLVAAQEESMAGGTTPLYLAVPLDQQGKLSEALALYRAQAEKTLTKADRLRYASALQRAGRTEEAKVAFDQVAREAAAVEHGGDGVARGAAVCASSLLANGFPTAALPYAWQAHRLRSSDRTIGLLLVRALAASGDGATARATLDEVARDQQGWVIGQRIELARWRLLTGDPEVARHLRDGDRSASAAQMFGESIVANVPLRARSWEEAAQLLADSERKVPAGLGDKRVDRAWRNVQRELWSVQLRRAITLWKTGKVDLAVAEAARAERSDEEYVRSGAILLLAAADLTHGQGGNARTRLSALAGHDPRFASAVAELDEFSTKGGDPGAMQPRLQTVLGGLDQSMDFVTQPLCEIVVEASHPRPTTPRNTVLDAVQALTASSGR